MYSPGGKLNALATAGAALQPPLSFHRLQLRIQGSSFFYLTYK
ncbi:hypothetical protein K661_03083 [Piscirickettsia salmonis LF-89 = ATCC VR-1361]|uniref:Uncharacterized protein n=1 Tax=Haematococcus lacustris TaxID=44745 RepID=A0A2K9YRV1_HAELA|nr:hypothetical protein SG3EUKT974137.1 [Haematococcus lacustris]YP_009463668.1 hypothetical protein SG3EUKT975766.1 [Haematococcus lacustris]AUW36425.1 hypothetical protein SG3EUKT974137.1 [Haematococcus lacustris]AUW36490.1 hypothetical protein SG3EUKT975766.1 [Haematococcus lacustris]ERL60596.1 hypothetical protein K661_03083 [Piscirickettsia salmonis LF-89 = ATCC VR-1361]